MRTDALREAVTLAETCKVLVATASSDGTPHLACAGRLKPGEGERVVVSEWFCPGTVRNVEQNPTISVTVWDEPQDRGYQLIGRVEDMEQEEVLDGYAPEAEAEHPTPQVKRSLIVRVETILDFMQAPHTDVEE